jgi:ABC-type Na+ efflux pump permease subunit
MADAWYYFQNGQQGGPVTGQVIQQLLNGGQLAWTDLVWRDGLAGWTAAEKVPELAALRVAQRPAAPTPPAFVAPPAPVVAPAPAAFAPTPVFRPAPAPVSVAPQPAPFLAGERVSERVVMALSKTRPWVRLISVLVIIACALMVLGGLGALIASIAGGMSTGGYTGGAAYGIGFGIAAFAVYLVIAALTFPVGLLLSRYASRIKDLQRSGRVEALETALFAQKSFWKYLGILTLINLVLYVLALVGLLIFGFGTFLSTRGL